MENKQEEIEGSKETTHLGWGAWCHAEIYLSQDQCEK